MVALTPLANDQVSAAAALLARSFHDNPFLKYVFPDEGERMQRSPELFFTAIQLALATGKVFCVDGAMHGVSLWYPPDAEPPDPQSIEQAGMNTLADRIGAGALARFGALSGKWDELRKRDAPAKHWYLSLIAVDPAMQGQGIATSLLQPVLDEADGHSLPCYLETADPDNVAFYLRRGFEVLIEDVDQPSGVKYWTFLRIP